MSIVYLDTGRRRHHHHRPHVNQCDLAADLIDLRSLGELVQQFLDLIAKIVRAGSSRFAHHQASQPVMLLIRNLMSLE